MAKCGDCLYFGFCKKYIDPEETFPEVGGCHTFKSKGAFVEVVRCKDCKHSYEGVANLMCGRCGQNINGIRVGGVSVKDGHFCSYGKRKGDGNG